MIMNPLRWDIEDNLDVLKILTTVELVTIKDGLLVNGLHELDFLGLCVDSSNFMLFNDSIRNAWREIASGLVLHDDTSPRQCRIIHIQNLILMLVYFFIYLILYHFYLWFLDSKRGPRLTLHFDFTYRRF